MTAIGCVGGCNRLKCKISFAGHESVWAAHLGDASVGATIMSNGTIPLWAAIPIIVVATVVAVALLYWAFTTDDILVSYAIGGGLMVFVLLLTLLVFYYNMQERRLVRGD